jgi:hypothetical protein
MVSRTREILFESASGEMITMDSLRPDEQGDLTANNFLMQDQDVHVAAPHFLAKEIDMPLVPSPMPQ